MENRDPKKLAGSSNPKQAATVKPVPAAGVAGSKPATAPRRQAVVVEAVLLGNDAEPLDAIPFERVTANDSSRAKTKPAPTRQSVDDSLSPEEVVADEAPLRHRSFLWTAAPSWLISLVVHVAMILVLAAISLDPVNKVISILQASAGSTDSAIEEFDLQGPELDSPESSLDDPLAVPESAITQAVTMPELQAPLPTNLMADIKSLDTNSMTESILPSAVLNSATMAQMSVALNSRSSASKSEMLEKFGGNAASEKAVAMALRWIAEHQLNTGGWSFNHSVVCRQQCKDPGDMALANNGATAMALLPFLGAGQTHLEGQYKETVKRGLAFLINRMKVTNGQLPDGSWHEPGGRMYSHGLAAITICEAYAMTQDPDLLQPAQLSLNYLINSQDPRGGGWRYNPREPGDTSVVGWCLMALKSGKMGNLNVPPSTFIGANNFLDFVSTNQGAYYGYDKPTSSVDGRHATTAVGLLCRMYLGQSKEHPGVKAGVEFLVKTGPRVNDLYYSYYATQVLRHYGGPEWENWNEQLRDELIKQQVPEGSGHSTGSWYTGGPHAQSGGRLCATSLATMILEVYYRHMPLYSEKSSDEDFEI